MTWTEWLKAVSVGVAVALLLSLIMAPPTLQGVSPLPKPLGLAFAQTVIGSRVPPWIGLLFHLVYVSLCSVVYIAMFRDRFTFRSALIFALILWVLVLLVFFPVVGWGFLGLGVSPILMAASLFPHLLFALFVWAGARAAFFQGKNSGGRGDPKNAT